MEQKHPVTGLYFGSVYFTEAETFLENSDEKEYCMIALDIENFHLFNHMHGEEEGDKLLQVVSEVLLEYQKEHDSVLGYFGGDNFSLLTEYDKDALERLCQSLREEIRIRNKTTGFPPGYGVYIIKDKQESVVSMYKHALVALSYVIGNYSSRYCEYDADMDGKQEEELRLLSEIQRGIEQDEFIFYIQPQVDIEQNKIVGGESLVRWQHGEKGMIPPNVFIPVMEKNGLVADLDQIVWEKVCIWIRSCLDRGYHPVPISINVSRIDIFSLDVPKYITSLVEKYDISQEFLKIEITESAYAEDEEHIVATVNRLREKGFVVMMDDFGSGYSSLNMLKSVPVDILKMDMRFLEINEVEEEKGIGILESVVNMARQMRIPIVVEGVEMQTQENLLRKMGCSYTQGFYYYRPMPVADFEEILSHDNQLDHNGFWYRQAESVHVRELLDSNLFDDTLVNNILGPAVFYEMVENKIEITRVNDQYSELAGISRHESEEHRKYFWNSVRDDDRANLYAIFEESYKKQEKGASGFIHFVRRDGTVLWINIRVYFLREKEAHRLFYASLTDMTAMRADTLISTSVAYNLPEFPEEQQLNLERYYGVLPAPFGIGSPVFDENGTICDFEINFVNEALSQLVEGNMERLKYLVYRLFDERKEALLHTIYQAAFEGIKSQDHVYSDISNQYYELKWFQYRKGYACCIVEDTTHAHIYETVSGNIMKSFREVYFLHLQDNYCRMIYPHADDILYRGNFEETISRALESGRIREDEKEDVRNFLSLENLKRELSKKNSVECKYRRSMEPAGEEWCVTTITVSERKNGIPQSATLTVRSIESLMREKESSVRRKMAKVLETMSDGFFIYFADGEKKILYANSAIIRMFGCKTVKEFQELTGNTFTGFVHPEDINRVEWEIKNQIEESDRNMDYIRYRIIRKDGSIAWVDDVGHLETTEYIVAPNLFYVFIADISDQITEAEKKMRITSSRQFNELNKN